jgi:hypothetical protein
MKYPKHAIESKCSTDRQFECKFKETRAHKKQRWEAKLRDQLSQRDDKPTERLCFLSERF